MNNFPNVSAALCSLLALAGLVLGEPCWSAVEQERLPTFKEAKPVWLKGRETEKNVQAGFTAGFHAPANERVRLLATGSTIYRAYLNGEFLGHGPARGPHGYYRVDEWDLTSKLKPGMNVVAFEVAGYNANS